MASGSPSSQVIPHTDELFEELTIKLAIQKLNTPIQINPSILAEGITECKHSFIGKFEADRPINIQAAKKTTLRAWNSRSQVHTIEEMNMSVTGLDRGKFMRLRLRMDIQTSLRPYVVLALQDNTPAIFPVTYEKLPSTCYNCGHMGHDNKHCEWIATHQQSEEGSFPNDSYEDDTKEDPLVAMEVEKDSSKMDHAHHSERMTDATSADKDVSPELVVQSKKHVFDSGTVYAIPIKMTMNRINQGLTRSVQQPTISEEVQHRSRHIHLHPEGKRSPPSPGKRWGIRSSIKGSKSSQARFLLFPPQKMSSKKEEERNEKIIRGLMKLPPNRRCINCNSLGPQYVCPNFWTFVCIACSGIHREFTHRVKSVSMAKFTSQEVEALQRGGNQRAREIFLKDWDIQRQRLPDSSNVDRVREFIKNVYVDRRYAGGKTSDKPPTDMQNLGDHEDNTRRASSYHSYSQSPPYEYQYEDRRYGKQAGVLTRKPGSDRGHYEGKISSFVYSPGRLGEKMCEERFANEGSVSRVSDYSASSGGDPFRSNTQSPNFQKDIGFSSPPVHPVRDILIEDVWRQTVSTYSEANAKRDANGIPRPQRTASSGSFGSFDSNSMSMKSVNDGSLIDVVSEPEQSAGIVQGGISSFPSLPQSSVSANYSSLDLFNAPYVQQPNTSSAPLDLFAPPATSSASSVDLFQPPPTSSASSIDLFHPPPTSSAQSINLFQPPPSSPSVDLFPDITHQHSATSLGQKPTKFSVLENEGWATFDLPQHGAGALETKNLNLAKMPADDGVSLGKLDTLPSMNASMQWPSVQSSTAHGPFSLMSNPWHGGLYNVQASSGPESTQSWNAFEDPIGRLHQVPFENSQQKSKPEVPAHMPPSTADQYLSSKVSEDFNKDGIQRTTAEDRPPTSILPSNGAINRSSFTPSVLPFMGGMPSHATDQKSSNPFDLPYDSDLEPNSMFLGMNSLQAALPNAQLPPPILGGLPQPWFPHNSVTPFIPSTLQGGLAYMAGQAPSTQLSNVPSQGSAASLGGNPFA
ncbi:hypothetical protein HHK36_011580 [Tetracentron sinense]|uniref:Uncharacterized protein n=2 Tax=Magnoliopsida TaxID=3398 RepID=A0A834ZGL7_TETSI|nr:hypothetical protein HHK36_011580 [Tetracentron sinense]